MFNNESLTLKSKKAMISLTKNTVNTMSYIY